MPGIVYKLRTSDYTVSSLLVSQCDTMFILQSCDGADGVYLYRDKMTNAWSISRQLQDKTSFVLAAEDTDAHRFPFGFEQAWKTSAGQYMTKAQITCAVECESKARSRGKLICSNS